MSVMDLRANKDNFIEDVFVDRKNFIKLFNRLKALYSVKYHFPHLRVKNHMINSQINLYMMNKSL